MKSKLLSNIRENPQNSLNLFKFLVFQRHKYMAPSKYILLTVQKKAAKLLSVYNILDTFKNNNYCLYHGHYNYDKTKLLVAQKNGRNQLLRYC